MKHCIVSGCQYNIDNLVTNVSLHMFPKDPIVLEAWVRNIGRTDLLPKHARVCSVHFSEKSFQQPRKKKNAHSGSVSKLRRLVPHAVPTLLLHATPVTPYVPFVIRREFPLLIAKPGNSKDGKLITDPTTYNAPASSGINRYSAISQLDIIDESLDDVGADPCNVTASSVNVETASAVGNPWLDQTYYRCRTPPRGTDLLITERSKSEPKRSDKLRTRKTTLFKRGKSKIKSRSTYQREMECHSMETSPLHQRRERYFIENCLGNDINNSQDNTEKVEKGLVQLLDEQVQHYRSLHDFHMPSICRDTTTRSSIEAENEALKLQLQHANGEIENLKSTVHDLQVEVERLKSLDKE